MSEDGNCRPALGTRKLLNIDNICPNHYNDTSKTKMLMENFQIWLLKDLEFFVVVGKIRAEFTSTYLHSWRTRSSWGRPGGCCWRWTQRRCRWGWRPDWLPSWLGSWIWHASTFKNQNYNCFFLVRMYFPEYLDSSPDSPEYLHVEEDEGEGRHDTGDHQPGPVYVEPGFKLGFERKH